MDFNFSTANAVAVAATFVVGAISGVVTMFYKMNKIDERIEKNENAINALQGKTVTRTELYQMHKDMQAEAKSMHKDVNDAIEKTNGKLDTLIISVNKMAVAIAGKADK